MLNPDPTRPGASRCDKHPALVLLNEQQAAAHLRDHHPELWKLLAGVEILPYTTRADRRRTRRHLARS